MMAVQTRSLFSPLKPDTIRLFPVCRTLAYYRRNLGHGTRLATRWAEFNRTGGVNLSQSRFSVIANVVALQQVGIEDEIINPLCQWLIGEAKRQPLRNGTTISRVETGEIAMTHKRSEVVQKIFSLSQIEIEAGNLLEFRERLGLSQSRFLALSLVVQSPLAWSRQKEVARAIIEKRYTCSQAGDYSHIAKVECGAKGLSDKGMAAFCNTFSYLLNREVGAEELFDDYLEEREISLANL